MRWCWMTWFCKGECSRLPAQNKKMTFDQASVCSQWEHREWKYQKLSEVGAFHSDLGKRFSFNRGLGHRGYMRNNNNNVFFFKIWRQTFNFVFCFVLLFKVLFSYLSFVKKIYVYIKSVHQNSASCSVEQLQTICIYMQQYWPIYPPPPSWFWDADAEAKVPFAENAKLSKVLYSKPGVGQNIALYVLLTAIYLPFSFLPS